MPLPKLRDAEIAWIIQQVAEYIERQRETYRGRAVPLDGHQRSAVQAFFPASTLNAARVIALAEERVSNPPFYPELHRMGFEPSALPNFSLMAAITFVDTVVSHEQFTDRLLFHELVHVIQYEKLGLKGFCQQIRPRFPERRLVRSHSAGSKCVRTGGTVRHSRNDAVFSRGRGSIVD
ncbi:MAG TPA: hypothetical protein VMG82_26685 [Candidatus Sulfotelmatobacter sp.]|nr:hypothetical protein [Candidatus Sulfotelmatobacter sp.]